MSVVGVNIGTEFGAKNCKTDSSELAFKAYSCAINIENHITSREADSKFKAILLENDFLRRMDSGSALRECARVIICLMQISTNMDFKQRPPIVYADLEHYGSLKDVSTALLEATARLSQLLGYNSNDIDAAILYREILNSVRLACAVAAQFGETDLELYVLQMLLLIERGWD